MGDIDQYPGVLTTTLPSGSIIMWYGAAASVPAGWALCDGTNGTPDMRGRVPVGVDTGQTEFDVLGEAGGAKTHTLTTTEMPAHTHPSGALAHPFNAAGATQVGATTAPTLAAVTGSTGGGGAHNNLQPYRALHFIMKL